jgi:GNAT superfamily N-acetyltransferase
MTFEKLTDYHGNTSLLAEQIALLAPSYATVESFALRGLIEPVPGMEHELYTLRDDAGRLAAFYTVGYHHVEHTLCCYLGLSAVRDDCKGQGLGARLWSAHFEDCRQMEARMGHRILLYFTTASPIPFAWFTRTLAEPAPDALGQCDELGRQRLRTIASSQYPQASWEAQAPYLLRRAVPSTRYSQPEEQRLAEIAAQVPVSFFSAENLDERNGDRLLVVGFVPAA